MLFHHFCETLLSPTFDDPEYRNDFALWADKELADPVLAERLGIINPYEYDTMNDLRVDLIDILEERLSEVQMIPWAKREHEFIFLKAISVVFDTGIDITSPWDLIHAIPEMNQGSIYFHLVEARWRVPEKKDDFTAWLKGWGKVGEPYIKALAAIDMSYLSLNELRKEAVKALLQCRY